jgi:hypothetical protein
MNNQKSKISRTIEGESMLVFKPNKAFYETTKINKKRWSQIYKGEKSPIMEEIEALANYFKIPVQQFFQNQS